jgi:hypothetical protein
MLSLSLDYLLDNLEDEEFRQQAERQFDIEA